MRATRRRFLAGAGGVALSLPWLEKLHGVASAQAASGPRRVILMTYSMGVPLGAWMPSGEGTSFTLPRVTAPLQPYRDRCLFVSAIDNRVLDVGGDSFVFGHPAKHEAALTGTLTTGAFRATNSNNVSEVLSAASAEGGANAASVEQVIGQYLLAGHRFPSIDLAVDGDAAIYQNNIPATTSSAFSWESRGNSVGLQCRPNEAFAQIFNGVSSTPTPTTDPAIRRRQVRHASVLDAVRDSFRDLSQGLGTEDRRRLDEHAGRIRQLEVDVVRMASEGCTVPTGIGGSVSYAGNTMTQLSALQTRIMAHAMACDLAPVGRIEFVNQQNPTFGVASVDNALASASAAGAYDWHAMVHGDALPNTSRFLRPGRDSSTTTYDTNLQDGYRFFVQQFANLLGELDSIAEGSGTTVLDNTLLILATDLGDGMGHGHMKMGYIMAGNLGGARTGYHYYAGPSGGYEPTGGYFYRDSRDNVNQLLNSMLDMAGVNSGGQPVTMGLQGYLEREGVSRRIDGLFR